ncbi:MAG: NAD(P)/FAD-dependent oxidoreductase [Pseudomonadales bacterium]
MPEDPRAVRLDALIVGGGIAGLWLANLLTRRGYAIALFEAEALGCAQTLGSQGMIHGGLKYALGGRLTTASEAISGMPARWRTCLAGHGDVDLSGLEPLSPRYYLFAQAGSLGRLTTFFASRALRGRITRLPATRFPEGLERLDGTVYELDDFVIDTPALLSALLAPVADRVFRHRLTADQLTATESGWRCRLTGCDKELHANRLVLCAGAGNGALVSGLGLEGPAMQLRPLTQVVARHPDLEPLYAHCLTGISRPEPRLTITSHRDPLQADRWLWYLGGQLASDGANRSDDEQIAHARQELKRCVPWVDWTRADLSCLRWDRAEPAQTDGHRPDEAFVGEARGVLVCWPTKLTLAPDLGDRVLEHLDPPRFDPAEVPVIDLPRAMLAPLPWVPA